MSTETKNGLWLIAGLVLGMILSSIIIAESVDSNPYFFDITKEALVKEHHAEWYTLPTTGKVKWQLKDCK